MATKKITAKMLKHVAKPAETKTVQVVDKNNKVYDIQVKSRLNMSEAMSFVAAVCGLCYDEETMEYMPELQDMALEMHTILMYTNIHATEDDIETLYELIHDEDFMQKIKDAIEPCAYREVRMACANRLYFLERMMAAGVSARVQELTNTMSGMSQNIEQIVNNVNAPEFAEVMNRLNANMTGISSDDAMPSFTKVK